jgi:hypothetical protein
MLTDDAGAAIPLQHRVLDRWADGSARWILLDWQASVAENKQYQVEIVSLDQISPDLPAKIEIRTESVETAVGTGRATIRFRPGRFFPFFSVTLRNGHSIPAADQRFVVEDDQGRVFEPQIDRIVVEEAGPLRAVIRSEGELVRSGSLPLADIVARFHLFANSATIRVELMLRNPRKADHPGGCWDLGGSGSILLRDASLRITVGEPSYPLRVRCSPEIDKPFEECTLPFELYQDSSGGENWRSTIHLNRDRLAPQSFRGYRSTNGQKQTEGLRATPIVCLESGDRFRGVCIPWFWQNFPKAVAVSDSVLTLSLFPGQQGHLHEIQGGEQKTHMFYLAFDRDTVTEEPLAWCRSPLLPRATPEWYCSSGALPYLVPRSEDKNEQYLRLVDAAIEGEDTFDRKREVIDEFGWRHFGDIYGDHEAVFHKGPTPLVSHYNNQYDPIAGFAYQFLRSGDPRWWRHMDELAAHVRDIDIYHTDRDKSAYNHGLFWHTFHYIDADTATHRTYPKAGNVPGGGPACEQNYTTGLLLHHFLTGSAASRDAALELAHWVLDMDDGHKTIFRWLDGGPTGLASATRTPSYHGPGRGSANSIAVLIDGHRLTGEQRYLAKAEELIRRCVHPADDIAERNLLDAENRWFYTMFLQSLGRFLDHKLELGQLDGMSAFARASLLHYARWMADNEYPYLDKPERLEYPTETWAAQDMRKSEVFKYAAKHATGQERERFLERSEFFFRYSTTTLSEMKTRTLARPVVLLLSFGFMHAYFQRHPHTSAPAPTADHFEFGTPSKFVTQKARAKKRLFALASAALICLLALLVYSLVS